MKNTFDFFNYNFSALISIFTALIGMAYPLILQAVQRIDDMYQSTELAKYVYRQKAFNRFNISLIVAIGTSLVAPFIIHIYCDSPDLAFCIESFHSIVITYLLYALIVLFKFVLTTTRPLDFLRHIKKTYSNLQPTLLEFFQMAKYASAHESIYLFMESMGCIRQAYNCYYENNGKKIDEDSVFHRNYVCVLDEIRKQLSKKDSGYFESYELLVDIYFTNRHFSEISELSYRELWKTLDAVSFNDKDGYFKKYWRSSEAFYLNNVDFKLQPFNTEDNDAIKTFKDFHFMLGAMLVYRKKWELLSQILMPVEVERNETYLVPTRLSDLLLITLALLEQNAPGRELSFRFVMKGMEDYKYQDELLSNVIYKYASILFIRLWLVGQYYRRDPLTFELPNIESYTLDKLYRSIYTLNRIKEEKDKWFEEENIETLRILVPMTITNEQMGNKIEEIRKKVISCILKKNSSIGTSEDKLVKLKEVLCSELKAKDMLLPSTEQTNSIVNEDSSEILHAYYGVTLDKSVIDNQSMGSPESPASFVINRLCSQLWSCYRRKFVLEPPRSIHNIYIKEFYLSLEKLGVGSSYAILLSFLSPEYFSNYYNDRNGLLKIIDGRYCFNGAPIYAFPFDNKYRAIIIKKSVLPYVEVLDSCKAEEDLTEIDTELKLSSNVEALNASTDKGRLLKVARNYKIHTSKDFMRYTSLEFILGSGLPSQIDEIKRLPVST